MTEMTKFIDMMKRVHAALENEDGVIETDLAMLVLASSLGYVLGRGLEEDAPIEEVYTEIVQKVDMARVSARSFEAAHDAIEKAKH
jgi:CRISPR/Cas system CSM-associated protein Csm2 small subunit